MGTYISTYHLQVLYYVAPKPVPRSTVLPSSPPATNTETAGTASNPAYPIPSTLSSTGSLFAGNSGLQVIPMIAMVAVVVPAVAGEVWFSRGCRRSERLSLWWVIGTALGTVVGLSNHVVWKNPDWEH